MTCPGAGAGGSLNCLVQNQRPHQAGTTGRRSWTTRFSVSEDRGGCVSLGVGQAVGSLGQRFHPEVGVAGNHPFGPFRLGSESKKAVSVVFCLLGPAIPLTPGDTPVRKKGDSLFDNGDDIVAALGFGDSPKAERRRTGDQ